jgi:hypothetical protein
MDASRFDAWTRRRFGLLAGGSIATLAGLSAIADSEAKKKKKKKKCKKSLKSCGGKKKCCKKLTCGDTLTNDSVCCKPLQGTCTDQPECCGDTICTNVDGLEGERCCVVVDKPCNEPQDCCTGLTCDSGTCVNLV